MRRRDYLIEIVQLLGALLAIVGAWIISRGLALMLIGSVITAIGTLAERSMLNGSGRTIRAKD